MTVLYEWILPLLGFLIAVFAAITGVGGGVLFVPLLTLGWGFEPSVAVGTSLMVMVFGGLGATISYGRQKRVYFKTGLLLALAAAPGAVVGAYLTSVLSSVTLGLAFAVFLLVLSAHMLYTSRYFKAGNPNLALNMVACEADCFRNRKRLAVAFVLSFFTGTLSGLLGVGVGVLLVPILLLVVYLPMHVAVGTSMFLMLLTSLSGVFQHQNLGNIDFFFVTLLAVGAFVGAQVGGYLSKKVPASRVQVLFAVALVVVSAQMILKYLSIV